MKNFREKIRKSVTEGRPLLGTFLQLPSPEIAEIFGYCGYDFVIIDNEHSVNDAGLTIQMVRAAEASGAHAIVRTPDDNEAYIKKALDMGADCVLVPNVKSCDDVKRIIRYAKYAPAGMRGSCPAARANHYGQGGLEYYRLANEKTAVMVQIEGRQACEEIDQILALEGLDGILLGPVDLSMALGHVGDVDHPEVIAMMNEILEKAKAKKVAVAAFAMDPESGKAWLAKGLNMLAYHIDSMMIREAAAKGKADLGL